MAKTHIRQSLNPTGVGRTGGVIPSDSIIRSIGKWADALEPRATPVSSRIKKSEAVDQVKHEWGQSYHTPLDGNLGGALANNATSVNFGSGAGKLLHQYAVVEITDYADANETILDYASRELVVVTDVSPSDTATVIRDVANRTNATTPASGAWPTHSSGAYWRIVGVAMPHNKDFALSPVTRGDMLYNFPQRFYGMVGADLAAQNTPTYEIKGNPMLRDFEVETMRLKHLLERTVVSGVRMEGDGADLPYTMGGIDWMIVTYAPAGNIVNCSGQVLSVYDFEELLRSQYKNIEDGGAKTLLMGPDTAAIIDTLLNPYRKAEMSTTSANFQVEKLQFRWGTLEIQPTQHLPEGRIIITDFSDIELKPYKGLNWSTKELATDGPYDRRAIFGEFTLVLNRPARHAIIHNFSLNRDMYPTREFF